MTEIRRLIKGEQKILKLTLTDKDTKLPINLTECTIEFKMQLQGGGGKNVYKNGLPIWQDPSSIRNN